MSLTHIAPHPVSRSVRSVKCHTQTAGAQAHSCIEPEKNVSDAVASNDRAQTFHASKDKEAADLQAPTLEREQKPRALADSWRPSGAVHCRQSGRSVASSHQHSSGTALGDASYRVQTDTHGREEGVPPKNSSSPKAATQSQRSSQAATAASAPTGQKRKLERDGFEGAPDPKKAKATIAKLDPPTVTGRKRTLGRDDSELVADAKRVKTMAAEPDAPTVTDKKPAGQHQHKIDPAGRGRRPSGLKNYNRACFMNATVQCLANVDNLMQFCKAIPDSIKDGVDKWGRSDDEIEQMSKKHATRKGREPRDTLRADIAAAVEKNKSEVYVAS